MEMENNSLTVVLFLPIVPLKLSTAPCKAQLNCKLAMMSLLENILLQLCSSFSSADPLTAVVLKL